MHLTALSLALALATTAAAAEPAGPRTWSVAPGSTVSYRIVHKLHAVVGTARAVEGRARLLPDGTVQAELRARVADFDSGNSNRDAHVQEVTEAGRFPFVRVRAVAQGIRLDAFPAEVEVPLRGVLEFHGVTRELAVTARVRFAAPDRGDVEATFPVSLTDHGVERPSLLFVPVEDRVDVTARLSLAGGP